jgi:cyclopropane-fatty-acyl-phospholipid synthase
MTSVSTGMPPVRTPRVAARVLLSLLEKIEVGSLEVTGPGGFRGSFGVRTSAGPTATLHFRDWRAAADILAGGDIGLADGYIEERWDTPDLVALLTLAALNQDRMSRAAQGSPVRRLLYRAVQALRANTRRGARRNIAAHYDLGNDFYRLWLDESMTYSAAIFGDDRAQPLALAQAAKYRRVVRELALHPGFDILEIGAGWGGFAEQLLTTQDVRYTGLSLSPAQTAFANARLAERGLQRFGHVALRDYRDEAGRYDAVASIEMIEAVGERYWPRYFAKLAHVLRPGGRAVVQSITIADDRFAAYRRGSDFIRHAIFPGGMLPTDRAILSLAGAAGLELEARYAFGADYSLTLRHWLRRFDAAEPAVRALGFDARFVRMWRFYLALCIAGFDAGITDVAQYSLRRASS